MFSSRPDFSLLLPSRKTDLVLTKGPFQFLRNLQNLPLLSLKQEFVAYLFALKQLAHRRLGRHGDENSTVLQCEFSESGSHEIEHIGGADQGTGKRLFKRTIPFAEFQIVDGIAGFEQLPGVEIPLVLAHGPGGFVLIAGRTFFLGIGCRLCFFHRGAGERNATFQNRTNGGQNKDFEMCQRFSVNMDVPSGCDRMSS